MAKPTEATESDRPRVEPDPPPTEALPPAGEEAAGRGDAGAPPMTSGGPRSVPAPGQATEATPARQRGTAPARRERRAVRGNGRPESRAEMRREIEQTRARMTDTLDALEARIEFERAALEQRKKQMIDRVTLKGVRQKMAEEPWRSMAIAFAAGYIIAAIRD